jgi:hypothetical protein
MMKIAVAGRACFVCLLLALAACGHQRDADDQPASGADHAVEADKDSPLSDEQLSLMGLKTEAITATTVQEQLQGQAQVMSHDLLAQLLADIAVAEAAASQSSVALQRVQSLAPTPGTLGADVLEQALRQSRVDAVQLQLTQRKLSAEFGVLPWRAGDKQLEALASGRNKLLQVLLPGALPAGKAVSGLQFVSLDATSADRGLRALQHWAAPVSGGSIGISLYAVVEGSALAEGAHLVALVDAGRQVAGLELPASAVVVHEGESWCYVQTAPGQFQRRKVDTSHPHQKGYALLAGFTVGEQVVTQGAGLLLSREFGQEAVEP